MSRYSQDIRLPDTYPGLVGGGGLIRQFVSSSLGFPSPLSQLGTMEQRKILKSDIHPLP
jgi:hypothetical protein